MISSSPPDPGAAELIRRLGSIATAGVNLRTLTTFRVGGPADVLVRVHTIAEMRQVVEAIGECGVKALVVGQGSNLLVADSGIRGAVIVLSGDFAQADFVDFATPASTTSATTISATTISATTTGEALTGSGSSTAGAVDRPEGRTDASAVLAAHPDAVGLVEVGAGMKMPVLARQAAARGRSGLEWMVGVPGSVGGGVRMNAGGHGSSVSERLIDVALWRIGTPEVRTVIAADLELGYRRSNLQDHDVVLRARFALGECSPSTAEEELAEIVRWRREHQPGGANCGSVFTNPPGDSAGRLIDVAGLRGLRIRTASVSEKHANFIQADDNASAADIWALIIEIRRRVFETFGVALHPEVRTAGFDAVLPPLSSTSPGGSQPTSDTPHADLLRP